MAKTKTQPPKHKIKPIPPLRSWEVRLGDGTLETITAHDCSTYNDALSFTRIEGLDAVGDRDWVLVRGFQDGVWQSVKLLEIPVDIPVPLPPEVH